MFDDPEQFAAYLEKLAEAGPKLRDAGYLRIALGPVTAELVQFAGDLTYRAPVPSPDDEDTDPLNDPVSYGLNPGEKLPFDDSEDEED